MTRAAARTRATVSTVPDNGINPDKLLNLEERLYEPVEVAFILGLQQTTVQKMCREGRILGIKPGKGWRISYQEIKRYLEEGPRRNDNAPDRSE